MLVLDQMFQDIHFSILLILPEPWHSMMAVFFFFFYENVGIYEAISGNLLDSDNLSLLNPYMVCLSYIFLLSNNLDPSSYAFN